MPHVEAGTIIFLGATTENPSFAMNGALLSRCRVVQLQKLSVSHLKTILMRAMEGSSVRVPESALEMIATLADGDARSALNTLDLARQAAAETKTDQQQGDVEVSVELVKTALQRTHLLWDRAGEQHYDTISALHKAIRGSDPDASLYWLARQLESGEDPRYVARRLIRAASEDIGLADPRALEQAVAAHQAVAFIGMPEAGVVLAQVVVYLAVAPKSTAVYKAFQQVLISFYVYFLDLLRLPLLFFPIVIFSLLLVVCLFLRRVRRFVRNQTCHLHCIY